MAAVFKPLFYIYMAAVFKPLFYIYLGGGL
jgi:hypothetical protein